MNIHSYDGVGEKHVEDCATGEWSQTYTGRRYYPEDPRPDQIDLIDIAVGLSNMNRYGGQCPSFSVAEHAIIVSKLVPSHLALAALHHDSSEAYITDVIRPVKYALGKDNYYFELERRSLLAIAGKFNFDHKQLSHPLIKYMDSAICITERQVLHPRADEWNFTQEEQPRVRILRLSPEEAARAFIRRHCDLTGEDAHKLILDLDKFKKQDEQAFSAQFFHRETNAIDAYS